MPSTPAKRKLLAAPERSASILSAAATAFARNGYAATTLDQVAAAAGVSKLIVYRHFNSKRELYLAILQQIGTRLDAVEESHAPVHARDGGPAIEATAEVLRRRFAVVRELPDAYRLLVRHAAREPEFAEFVTKRTKRERRQVEARLANVADPTVRRWLATVVIETVQQAFLAWLDAGTPARDDELAERVSYLLAGMVGSLWDRAAARGDAVGPADR
ncbi:TetR/AcrR family transcriptional regulator [Kribbella sp. GL6]|uniref:TetR/AcrR family transcriptional regulator n=1 Tax=Kribbella sp. GL6 TaxID=3419765 RepID=UPI003D007BFE